MVDAWILRSMHRRCNYDREVVVKASDAMQIELNLRNLGAHRDDLCLDQKVGYYREQYTRSTLADVVILPYLDADTVKCLSTEHIEALVSIVNGMLQYQPFELVTIHDAFHAHPNNLNWVRKQYRNILADIAASNVLDDLLSQLYGEPVQFDKLSFNLPDQIRNSEYALS